MRLYSMCGELSCRSSVCSACDVVQDTLLERGVTELGALTAALFYHPQKWKLRDVKEVPVVVDDGSDEPNFTWVIGFMDGRWAAVRGWHDYTGWDCKSDLSTEWYATKDDAMRALVDWEREAMGAT